MRKSGGKPAALHTNPSLLEEGGLPRWGAAFFLGCAQDKAAPLQNHTRIRSPA
jgi:hypothetical protein